LEEYFRANCCSLKEMNFKLRDSTKAYSEGDWILVEDGMLHFDGLRSESRSHSFWLSVSCKEDSISVDFRTEVVKSRRLTNTQCSFPVVDNNYFATAETSTSITLPSAIDLDGNTLTYSY